MSKDLIRRKQFDRNRNMAEAQLEQFQRELSAVAQKLNEREHQLAHINQQSQNQVAQLQAQLNDVLSRLDDKEREIALLQINMAEVPNVHATPTVANDDFSRGRVPDIIKGLPQYSGSSHQLSTWIQSVERIIRHFRSLHGTAIFELWLQEIRNKIIGEAGDMLASNGIPLEWNAIKSQLTLLYGDKRELSTLLQKLFGLKQNRSNVHDFYSSIRDCFTGISTHIQTSEEWEKPAELVKFVDKLCLEKFVDGLDEPFATHVSLSQPATLNQAFQYAIDKANRIARKTGEYDVGKTHQKPVVPPRPSFQPNIFRPPPMRQFNPQFQQPHNNFQNKPLSQPINHRSIQKPQPSFQPHRQYNSQPNRPPYTQQNNQQYRSSNFQQNFPSYRPANFQQNFPSYRPQIQTQQQKIEPMDVDHSIRSRNINYMNRPNFHLGNEPDYEFYYEPEPNNLDYYQTTEQVEQNYEEQIDQVSNAYTENTLQSAIKSNEPVESASKQEIIDDLNFHTAYKTDGMT